MLGPPRQRLSPNGKTVQLILAPKQLTGFATSQALRKYLVPLFTYCWAISFESVKADGKYNTPSDPSSTSPAFMKKLVSKTL